MSAAAARLLLPTTVEACLFDLDGVLTDTAALHAEAWKETFDGMGLPFDLHDDYARYVDGKERNDGVRSFLHSRGVELPDDEVRAIGDRKNDRVLELIHERGALLFDDAVELLRAVRAAGLATAVVSSSTNCHDVLDSAAIADSFDAVVDAVFGHAHGLRGKPAPDMFLAAAGLVGAAPAAAAVFEDAIAGVEAGRAGGFTPVVGVARSVPADELRAHGADLTVHRLSELLD